MFPSGKCYRHVCVVEWFIVIPFPYRSQSFRQVYARIGEIRAFVPSGIPVLAVTATVTKKVQIDVCHKLEMSDHKFVWASPERPNTYYEVLTVISDHL